LHLCEKQLLRPQLPHECFKLCTTYVVFERAQVELGSGAVKNGNAESTDRVDSFLWEVLADGNEMTSLVVSKHLWVKKGSVGIDFVQFPGQNSTTPPMRMNLELTVAQSSLYFYPH
jgi:hypothetical protein